MFVALGRVFVPAWQGQGKQRQFGMISAGPYHLVRVGVLGQVGRFPASDGVRYPRGTRVVCRTARGLEMGEVLSNEPPVGPDSATPNWLQGKDGSAVMPDGSLVRALTAEDELLQSRLKKNRNAAYDACANLLTEHRVSAVLVDVEHLFDGSTLYFYFLGDVPNDIQPLVDQLGEAYEAKVQFRDFATAVEEGCGPDCGTDDAAGCGTGGCSTCSIASACKSD